LKLIVILDEFNYRIRYVHTDGRKPDGDSVGRRERDTLVGRDEHDGGVQAGPYERVAGLERFGSSLRQSGEIHGALPTSISASSRSITPLTTEGLTDAALEEPSEFVCNENRQLRRRVTIGQGCDRRVRTRR
jgi:hypothetical protein